MMNRLATLQIPSLIIAKELKKKVTVALTGDGGDENFWRIY